MSGIVPSEIAGIARKLLVQEYPAGIASRILTARLEKQGANKKQVSNGLYKLTSGGIAEIAEDGCYYLTNDPHRIVPIYPPQAKKPAPAKTAAVTKAQTSKRVTVTPPKEAPMLSDDEKDALAFVNRIPNTIDELLAPEDDAALLAIQSLEARLAGRVEDVPRKLAVLGKLGAILDPSIAAVLEQIGEDLAAHAA